MSGKPLTLKYVTLVKLVVTQTTNQLTPVAIVVHYTLQSLITNLKLYSYMLLATQLHLQTDSLAVYFKPAYYLHHLRLLANFGNFSKQLQI